MSGFLSSKYLKYHRASQRRKITQDHFCRSCGYNVRGLNYGRNCPECGAIIETPSTPGASGPLFTASREQRKRWRLGLALATLCVAVVLLARLALFVDLVFLGGLVIADTYLFLGLALSVAWIAGVLLITPPEVGSGPGWRRKLRAWVRLSQWLWLPGYAAWIVAVGPRAGAGSEAPVLAVSLACRGVAGAGALGLAVLLQPVAEAAELDDAPRHLNAAVWLLPIPSILLAVIPSSIPWIFIVLLAMLLLLPWAWFMSLYARGLLEMYRCVNWWLEHSASGHTRIQRITETRAAAEDQLKASVRPPPPQEPDLPLEPRTGKNDPGEGGGRAHGRDRRE